MKQSDLRRYIKKCIEEVLSEDDSDIIEMNTTASADGYQTPHAFSKDDEDDHGRAIKATAEVFDYTSTENKKGNTVKLKEHKSLFHMFRDHPDFTPEQKVGVTVREINKLVTEIEKLLKVSSRYKIETNIKTSNLWKTTNKYLISIDEKLKRVSHKIKEMR